MTNGTPASAQARIHVVTALAALAVLVAGSGSPAAAATAGQSHGKIIGSKKTKILLAKVHRAYLHVPAVELSVISGRSKLRFARRFVLILRSGVVVAEEFTRPGRGGTTLIDRRGGPTYARKAGAKCWHRLAASKPQTLADVGIPYPYTRVDMKVLPPKATSRGWDVMSENRAEFWFLALQRKRPAHLLDKYRLPIKRFITYAIDRGSHRLSSIFIQQPSSRRQNTWSAATFKVTALTAAPQLPSPRPVC